MSGPQTIYHMWFALKVILEDLIKQEAYIIATVGNWLADCPCDV